MKCVEEGCLGDVDVSKRFLLITGCASNSIAHPCGKCGRLHFEDGSGVKSRQEKRAFVKENRLVHRDEEGVETVVF